MIMVEVGFKRPEILNEASVPQAPNSKPGALRPQAAQASLPFLGDPTEGWRVCFTSRGRGPMPVIFWGALPGLGFCEMGPNPKGRAINPGP